MNKKKEQKREKKLEGVVVKPEESRDLIKKNLMEMFKKQGIKVKKGRDFIENNRRKTSNGYK